MDLDKLKTFYRVATVGSISGALKSLQMDKSSVSRHLSLLEEQIGSKLFDRSSKKLILTPHGSFLLNKAKHILMEVEATKTALQSKEKRFGQTFTISATHALTSTWLTQFLHYFIEENPDLQIKINATSKPLNLSLREADLALRPYCNNGDNLIQKHLMTWRLNLFASKSYLERFGMPRNLDDLGNHRLLIFGDLPNLYPYSYTN